MSVGRSRGSNLMKVSRNFGRDWISLDSAWISLNYLFRANFRPVIYIESWCFFFANCIYIFLPEIIRRSPSEGYLRPSPGIALPFAQQLVKLKQGARENRREVSRLREDRERELIRYWINAPRRCDAPDEKSAAPRWTSPVNFLDPAKIAFRYTRNSLPLTPVSPSFASSFLDAFHFELRVPRPSYIYREWVRSASSSRDFNYRRILTLN